MKDKKVVKLRKSNFFKNTIFIPFILIATSIIILAFSPLFDITNIQIEGNFKLTENSIVDASNITLGQNILRLNKQKIKEDLLNLSYIEEVSIRRKWPNTILISVIEKDGLAKIQTFASTIVIDDEGKVLESYSDNSEINMPLIENIEVVSYGVNQNIETPDADKINNLIEVLKILQKNDMLNIIEKLEQNENILLYTNNGHVINIGDTNDLDYKIKRLKAVLEREKSENYYFDMSNINISPISKPLWTLTEENQHTEVIE